MEEVDVGKLEEKVVSLEKALNKAIADLDAQIKLFNKHIKDLHIKS